MGEQKQPPEVFCKKKVFLKISQFTGKHLYWSFLKIKLQTWRATSLKKTPTQVFSCENCKISKDTYIEEHLRTTASWKTVPKVFCKSAIGKAFRKFLGKHARQSQIFWKVADSKHEFIAQAWHWTGVKPLVWCLIFNVFVDLTLVNSFMTEVPVI